MLLFVDEPRNIKVIRQEPAGLSREPLGKIRKVQLEISEELNAKLKPGEAAEIHAVLDFINKGEQARISNMVANFPATMREVLAYYRENATEAEQRWILGSLLEGLRVVRKHEREANLEPIAA